MNNNNTTDLFLFTAQYPYGNGETFIETELSVLSSQFSKIYIFPLKNQGEARLLPSNVIIVNWSENYQYNGIQTLLKNIAIFWKISLNEFSFSSDKNEFIKRFPEFKSSLLQNISRAVYVNGYINKLKNNSSVFYSYWFDDWSTSLGVLKLKKKISGYITRAHGFDLYEERRVEGYIPFRNFQMRTVNTVFAISNHGVDYLSKKLPQYHSKIKLSYLGVIDRGLNPFEPEQQLTLVSCSNLIPLKRIHLIIEVLKHVHVNLNWIHFGDGALRMTLEQEAKKLPANISVNFKGQTRNEDIINFYKKNGVHLFFNVSETEGLPVTIQEAISFGIPVMAPDVGGISEIVNQDTGILIPGNFDVKGVAKLINEFKMSHRNTVEFRVGVRAFWKKKFDAETNYALFCKQLLEN